MPFVDGFFQSLPVETHPGRGLPCDIIVTRTRWGFVPIRLSPLYPTSARACRFQFRASSETGFGVDRGRPRFGL